MSRELPHLPAGREPGPQSVRNRSRRNLLVPFVGIVGTAMYAAGVWVAAGGRGDRFDRQEELLGGLLFAAMGLLCVFAAFVIAGRGRPKRTLRLAGMTLRPEGETFRRGGEIAVTFSGRRSDDDRLEIGIACDERFDTEVRVVTQGTPVVTRQLAEDVAHEEWQPVPAGAAEHVARFAFPADAPYSYEGDYVSFAWRVSVRDVRPARADARHDEPIWVEP